MAVANELVTKFTFQGDLSPLKTFDTTLASIGAMSLKVVGGIAVATAGIFAFTSQTVNAVDELNDLSNALNINIEELQKLGYVAQLNGSNAEAMGQGLRSLSREIGQAVLGQNEIFQKLGINIKDAQGKVKDTSVVFDELQGKFGKLGTAEQFAVLRELRLDPSLIQTLRLSREEFAALKEEAAGFGVVTKAQAEAAAELNDNLDRLKFRFGAIRNQVALSLVPKINEGTQAFSAFLDENKLVISEGLSKLFAVIQSGFGALVNFGRVISGAIDNTLGWKNALGLLAGAFIYLNRAMLLSPIGLITAGIVGLIVIVDDLVTAFDGGESVIADFFKSFDIDIVDSLTKAWGGLKTMMSNFFNLFLAPIIEGFLQINNLVGKLLGFAGIDLGADKALAGFREFRKQMSTPISQPAIIQSEFSKPLPILQQTKEANTPSPIFQRTPQASFVMPKLQEQVMSINAPRRPNAVTQTNDIKINVSSTDPVMAGQAVTSNLEETLKRSTAQAQKGGY